MADFNSSLPVRTETNGDVAVKVVDGTTPSQTLAVDASGRATANQGQANGGGAQAWPVKPTDGTNSQSYTGAGEAKVDITQPLPAGTNTIGSVKLTDGTNTASLTGAGEVKVDVTQPLPAGTNTIGNVNSNTRDGAGTAITSTLVNSKQRLDVDSAADGVSGSAVPFATTQVGGSDGTNLHALSTDTNGKLKVDIFDSTGTAFSPSNPLSVSVVSGLGGATEVLDFKQATAVAAAANDTHTYTITSGKTLSLQHIQATGSGKIKVEISLGTIGSEVLKIVLFNSTANPNVDYVFQAPQNMPDTQDVVVKITNLDKQPQDVYSTIEGYES